MPISVELIYLLCFLRRIMTGQFIPDQNDKTQPTSAIALVRQFRTLRALVIGDAMLDTYLEGTATRLCSEGPVPVVSRTAEYRIPGGAANTAANLRALDAEVIFLGGVGRDLAGSLLRSALRERGISDQWLIEDEAAGTLHKLRILADGQYVVRFDEGGVPGDNGSEKTSACRQLLLKKLEEAYALCDFVVISDYRYGVCSAQLIARLQELHESHPKVLLIDSKAGEHFRHMKATVITPNYQEACLLVERMGGTPGHNNMRHAMNEEVIEHIGKQLLELLAAEHVAITLGERGVSLFGRQKRVIYMPAHLVAQAHDVGAGDSFAAAMALALAAGGKIEEATRIGIDAAGIAVTKPRTANVRYQELLQRVSLRAYAMRAQETVCDLRLEQALLAARLHGERLAGQTVVFTNGIFDMLHAGHVQFLRQAKALGNVLVVGLNSDSCVQHLRGHGWPINSAQDRMALVAALDMVDHVVLFDEDTPAELIRTLRPDIHVKGGDYVDEALPEAEAVREVGGRVVILPLAGSRSTSSMIDRITAVASDNDNGQKRLHVSYRSEYITYQSDMRGQGGEI
jgi:D-beta-D-heptose 7-phosphate kinase/D-beta-D-heptose 1-phosphate adenosyltransferase